jgi:hypothetical protein
MNALEVINLARQHIGKGNMVSSAQLCLDDAMKAYEIPGWEHLAKERALKSLAYSVGIAHPDYQNANK